MVEKRHFVHGWNRVHGRIIIFGITRRRRGICRLNIRIRSTIMSNLLMLTMRSSESTVHLTLSLGLLGVGGSSPRSSLLKSSEMLLLKFRQLRM
jgi:hypothetical protein